MYQSIQPYFLIGGLYLCFMLKRTRGILLGWGMVVILSLMLCSLTACKTTKNSCNCPTFGH